MHIYVYINLSLSISLHLSFHIPLFQWNMFRSPYSWLSCAIYRFKWFHKISMTLFNESFVDVSSVSSADTLQLKHGFRIHDRINDLWYTFSCRSPADEERWLRAFHEERQRVDFDRDNGFDLRKFKEKAFCSQLKLRQLYPSSRTKGSSPQSFYSLFILC